MQQRSLGPSHYFSNMPDEVPPHHANPSAIQSERKAIFDTSPSALTSGAGENGPGCGHLQQPPNCKRNIRRYWSGRPPRMHKPVPGSRGAFRSNQWGVVNDCVAVGSYRLEKRARKKSGLSISIVMIIARSAAIIAVAICVASRVITRTVAIPVTWDIRAISTGCQCACPRSKSSPSQTWIVAPLLLVVVASLRLATQSLYSKFTSNRFMSAAFRGA